MTTELKTTDVHEALKEAQFKRLNDAPFITTSFKIEEPTKLIVDEICRRHGITTSEFVRECCYALVRDYGLGSSIDS